MFCVNLCAKLRKARPHKDFSYIAQNTNLQFIYKKFAQSVLKETGYEILHIFSLKKFCARFANFSTYFTKHKAPY